MFRLPFSLVVTCRNEMPGLLRWRCDIEAQTRQPDEIVIVDSESTDGTTEYLHEWAKTEGRVRVIVENCKPARGHNLGNAAARNEIILSTDMGVRLAPEWCEELIKPFEADPTVEVVAGATQIDRETVKSAAARAELYLENGGVVLPKPGQVVGNRSVAYLKRVWRELGGLPEDLTFYADDSVFGRQILQAGYKMAYAPRAMTYWGRPARLRQFWKEQWNYGRGDGEADIKKPYAVKLWEQKRIPAWLVPWLNGLRAIQKRNWARPLAQALRQKDWAALGLMPVLVFGNGYHFARGYLVGAHRGQTACLACRQRLRADMRS